MPGERRKSSGGVCPDAAAWEATEAALVICPSIPPLDAQDSQSHRPLLHKQPPVNLRRRLLSVSQHEPKQSDANIGRLEEDIREDRCRGGVVHATLDAPSMTMLATTPDDAPCRQDTISTSRQVDDHDMPSTPPSLDLCPDEELGEGTFRPYDDDNLIFRELRVNRQNLVLDSLHPHVPHIVITPPEDLWDTFAIPSQNGLGFQSSDHLTIPVFPLQFLAHLPHLPIDSRPDSDPHETWDVTGIEENGSRPSRPQAVFNREKFLKLVERSSTERLVMYHVHTALQRHCFKIAAVMASQAASSFRKRYDCPERIREIEKPFRWLDPAEPVLLASRYFRGSTIIDSVSPFTVPHIIISEPPPQSPWIAWFNATNDPQDCNHGRNLTVPSRFVSFVKTDDLAHADDYDACASQPDLEQNACSSPPDTPAPGTPPSFDDGRDDADAFLCVQDDENSMSGGLFVSHGEDLAQIECAECDDAILLARPSCDGFAIGREDEDDDLPPFDDWYRSIQQRACVAN